MRFRQPENLVYHNTKAKIYPGGQQKVMVCSKPTFKSECWERIDKLEKEKVPILKPEDTSNEVRGDSLKHARGVRFDIACCDSFHWFITWTLDQQKIDRCDPKEVGQKLREFLDNKVERNDARYIVIPEHHADGKGIHIHGLLVGDSDMVDSGKEVSEGKTIYNMLQWKYGRSMAIESDSSKVAVTKYVTKYVTKDFRGIFGSFYHAGGKGLTCEPSVQLLDTDFKAVKMDKIFKPSEWSIKYKYVDINEQAAEDTVAILGAVGEVEYVYG